MSHGVRRFLPLRSLTVCLALVANLFAAGVPLLHSAAHALHDDHPHEIAAAAEHEAGHGHAHDPGPTQESGHAEDEVHPSSLHDDCALLRRIAPDFCFLPAATLVAIDGAAEHPAPASRPVASLRSRAPPPGDPARAPPLA